MGNVNDSYRALGIEVGFSPEEEQKLERVVRERKPRKEDNREGMKGRYLDKAIFYGKMGKDFVREWGAPEKLLEELLKVHPRREKDIGE
jgi:hypothetical protein